MTHLVELLDVGYLLGLIDHIQSASHARLEFANCSQHWLATNSTFVEFLKSLRLVSKLS